MLSPRIVRPQPHHGTASAGSSSSSRRHMVDARVPEWERGLPSSAELIPPSHPLIPPALAAAFGIGPAQASPVDAARFLHQDYSPTSHLSSRFDDDDCCNDDDDEEGEGETEDYSGNGGSRGGEKKARMVWTPSLHHRFVEAVDRLGDKGAVPKAIVRLMNVHGLTRENVASHLQKYRLYLKRARTTTTAHTQPPQPQAPPPPFFPGLRAQQALPPHQDAANHNDYCPFVSYDKLGCD